MFDNIYKDKKVLITGHTGFKGCWLSLWLTEIGAKVYGLSYKSDNASSFFNEIKSVPDIHHMEADISNLDELKRIIKDIQPDFLFHLAAQAIVSVSYKDPVETFLINGMGTANVLEALRLSNHKCVAIVVSSDKCYENKEWVWGYRENDSLGGKDPYSASKSIAEIIVKSYYYSFFSNSVSNIKICSVRSGNVIGGGDWSKDRIIPDCIDSWRKHTAIEIRSPNSTRPWQFVLDTLHGYLKAGQYLYANEQLSGESFNFGPSSEGEHTVRELVNEFIKHWDYTRLTVPYNIQNQKLFKEANFLKLNCDKARNILNWKPILNFSETVRFTAEWYNKFMKKESTPIDLAKEQISKFSSLAMSEKN